VAQRILIADDSPTIQRLASGILAGEGLEVVTVANGIDAIRKLPAVNPHLILADVSMPGKDGYEVCEFVKNSPEMAQMPVLLICSELEPYEEERGKLVRADGSVKKPFDPKELIETVEKFLRQSEDGSASSSAPSRESPDHAASVEPAEPVSEARPIPPIDLTSLSEGVAFTEAFGGSDHWSSAGHDFGMSSGADFSERQINAPEIES
jgi:CheY-like chemotaxis protein